MVTNLTQTKPQNPPTIMTILNFNLGDLSANKAGKLSKRQLRLAESGQPNLLVQMVLLGHVTLIIGVMALIVLASGVTSGKLLFLGVASMVVLSPFLYAMNRMNESRKSSLTPDDIASGEVLSVTGDVTLHPSSVPNQPTKIQINEQSFTVPKALLDLLNDGQPVCVYYTTHSKRLVSLEVLA